jgi:hypothetical protein
MALGIPPVEELEVMDVDGLLDIDLGKELGGLEMEEPLSPVDLLPGEDQEQNRQGQDYGAFFCSPKRECDTVGIAEIENEVDDGSHQKTDRTQGLD